jgi:hypothetical protein
MPVSKRPSENIIDSRHLKIVATKKQHLNDSVAFLWLDEDRIGELDLQQAGKMGEQLVKYGSNMTLFIAPKKYGIEVFDASEFKNRDIVVTVTCPTRKMNAEEISKNIIAAFGRARSVKVVCIDAEGSVLETA